MTSFPQVPGAPAVYLFREETTDDSLGAFNIYVRLKVLTESGLSYADVEVPYQTGHFTYMADSISGRTIHADGTVVPLMAKPYDKLIEKTGGTKRMAKVFTMPAAEVGSILEYRFKLHLDDDNYSAPSWYIQSKLFTLKAHYQWRPTAERLLLRGEREVSNSVAWMPILPPHADFKQTVVPAAGIVPEQNVFDLNVTDVPPAPDEEYMPPMESFTFRMIFFYSTLASKQDFWKSEGKYWSTMRDRFIGHDAGLKSAVQQMTSAGDSDEQRLRKIYGAVMELENTDFSRERTTAEERAGGLREIKTASDVWVRRRGSSDQITDLFLAMARAAGMKAYVMGVVNRNRSVFNPGLRNIGQLDDHLAIVEVGGQERYFDPGERYCEFGHLAWKHTSAVGIRQTAKETAIVETPGEPFKSSIQRRVANLNLDEQGGVTGKIDVAWTGDYALHWRQGALLGDSESLKKDLREWLQKSLPAGLDIRVTGVDHVADYENPLTAHYEVTGPAGNLTGKRIILLGDLFQTNARPTFSEKTRTTPVYFHYAASVQDAVRVNFPAGLALESLPQSGQFSYKNIAGYSFAAESTPTSFTVRRNLTVGDILFLPNEFPELLSFYTQLETRDKEPVVLTRK